MKHVKWVSSYCILIGVSMTGMWVFFILKGMVPELTTIPLETVFSIAADNVTALLLVAAGYGLITGKQWAGKVFMISMGALFYSLMIAIGYYAQLGEYTFLGVFAIIFALMLFFTYTSLKYWANTPDF